MENKEGVLSSLKGKVWAGVLSSVAAITASGTMYFWKHITGEDSSKAPPPAPRWSGHRPGFARGEAPSDKSVPTQTASFKGPKATPELPGEVCPILNCRVDDDKGSVRVLDVPPGTCAAQLGLIPGDVIEKLNTRFMQSTADIVASMTSMTRSKQPQDNDLVLRRGDTRMQVDFRVRADNSPIIKTSLRPLRK